MPVSDRRVRYYSPAFEEHVHEAILLLLAEIRSRHRIATEVVPLRVAPSPMSSEIIVPDEANEKEIYDRDFWPRWPFLSARTKERIAKVLRSNSGNHFVAGVVAVCSDEGLQWYAVRGPQFLAYMTKIIGSASSRH
jgi:hypothetical protein